MPLTIVMYHYVRDLARSRFPGIKGRDLEEFKRQLAYIGEHFTVVTAQDVIAACKGQHHLPDNAAWLTFDDGYIDHFINVFPLLRDRGWQGAFFPTVNTILHGELLDVNKIHFILAAQPDVDKIIAEIKTFIELHNDNDDVHDFDTYWKQLAQPSRFDPAEVIFVKRVLQHGLPENLRNQKTAQLFRKFVSDDMSAFGAELYMSIDQIKTLVDCGMYVGSHGAKHHWLDRLTPEQQDAEIEASLNFLEQMGAPTSDWVMCYPYGAYNEALFPLLEKRNCAAALTTRVAVAQIGMDPPLALPRMNTNDLPV